MIYHISVLLQEAIDALQVKSGQKYIDGTLGGGGHTRAILENGGLVLGIDVDQDALEFVEKDQEARVGDKNLILARGNFKNIDEIAKENGFEKVSGIILDLGVSSHQIDTPSRGFSYLKSGPLDMRMDQGLGVKAKDLVNALGKKELYQLFIDLGEDRNARNITDQIIKRRQLAPFETTDELVDVLAHAYGFGNSSTDFAKSQSSKKVFQALRIQVNSEIDNLEEALPKAITLLEDKGRLVVITFHSLEDRVVKNSFKDFESKELGEVITKEPIYPTEEEVQRNSRSKGSKMRIFEINKK